MLAAYSSYTHAFYKRAFLKILKFIGKTRAIASFYKLRYGPGEFCCFPVNLETFQKFFLTEHLHATTPANKNFLGPWEYFMNFFNLLQRTKNYCVNFHHDKNFTFGDIQFPLKTINSEAYLEPLAIDCFCKKDPSICLTGS